MVEQKEGRIVVSGRIDSLNAAEFEKELLALCEPGKEALLDASDLLYISSAGLRVLLKLKKQIKSEVTIDNVSNDVYQIFEVTGFTEILNVQKKLRELSIDGCEMIGEGANGQVYRFDDETIVKVFDPMVPYDTVQAERDFAQAAFVSGVPTAISYDVVKVGESYGAVYEMLHAKTLGTVIAENPSRAEEMGTRMGTLLKELHETLADKSKLTNMLSVYRERAAQMEKYLSKEEHEKVIKLYEVLEERDTLLHGDFHIKNIMYQDDELVFIDMGDVGYGHPLLDLGGTYLPMCHLPNNNPEITSKFVGISADIALRVWENFLNEYLAGKDVEEGRKLIQIYGEAKRVLSPTFYTKATEELTQRMIQTSRENGFLNPDFDISLAFHSKLI